MPKNKILKQKPAAKAERKTVNLIEAELHYFKGLSIVIFVIFVCVFFAFGALFSAMYLEVRMARQSLQNAFVDQYLNGAAPCENFNIQDVQPNNDWLSFSKYGFQFYFPLTWSFLDKPLLKQVKFFQDGKLRNEDNSNASDVVVTIAARDLYSGKYPKVGEAQIAGVRSSLFEVKIGDVIYEEAVVPFNSEFINIRFKKQISQKENLKAEIIQQMIEKFQILK